MNIFKKIALSAVVAAASISTSAQAGLIGDTITATGSNLNSNQAVIGSGSEFNIGNEIVFDFGAGTLTITTPIHAYTWSALGNYVFGGFDDTITNVAFVPALEQNFGSGKADFINDFSFTAHSITFSLQGGSSQNKNSTLVFNITTTPTQINSASVPEPTTVALLGLGLMGVAASRRKLAKKDA